MKDVSIGITYQIGCDTPSPFLSVFPLESMRSWRCDNPPEKGYLSDTCAIPYENKANECDTPLCDTISKGYCAIRGGISHWAAKSMGNKVPWKTGVMICHPVTSRPLIFPWKEAVLSPCNFATTHLTASILNLYLLLTSRPQWH